MKAKFFILTLSAILLTGCTHQPKLQTTPPEEISMAVESPEISPSPTDAMIEETTMEKQYSMEEIEKHNTPSDCWFALDGSVYDVSAFIKLGIHPGGAEILKGCGKDATQLFHTKAGKGQDHTETAQSNLPKYKIGILVQSQ